MCQIPACDLVSSINFAKSVQVTRSGPADGLRVRESMNLCEWMNKATLTRFCSLVWIKYFSDLFCYFRNHSSLLSKTPALARETTPSTIFESFLWFQWLKSYWKRTERRQALRWLFQWNWFECKKKVQLHNVAPVVCLTLRNRNMCYNTLTTQLFCFNLHHGAEIGSASGGFSG